MGVFLCASTRDTEFAVHSCLIIYSEMSSKLKPPWGSSRYPIPSPTLYMCGSAGSKSFGTHSWEKQRRSKEMLRAFQSLSTIISTVIQSAWSYNQYKCKIGLCLRSFPVSEIHTILHLSRYSKSTRHKHELTPMNAVGVSPRDFQNSLDSPPCVSIEISALFLRSFLFIFSAISLYKTNTCKSNTCTCTFVV